MKTKLLIPAVLGFTLSLSALSAMAQTHANLLGEPASGAAADQTITIDSGTRYVNVEGGKTVRFDVGGQTFAWNFDGPETVQSFDLTQVAPPGLLDHTVTAYVSPDPLYMGS